MQSETLADRSKTTSCETAQPNKQRGFGLGLFAVLAACAMLYVAFAVFWVKFSRAEVFFAECAREMIAENNMVTPLYHHKPFFDKPILVYWLIVSAFQTFGITHFVARVPSILAGLATVALTGFATQHLAVTKKREAGLLAAMCLGSSFMFFSFAYLCMSDMFLVMFDTTTMMLLYAALQNERRRGLLFWLASVSMGFAFVTKGPVGVVLPGIAFVAYLAMTKQLSAIKPLHVVLGAITATLIAVPWFYAAYKANGTWALAYFFIRENFQRYAGSTYDTHKPIWFMVQSLVTGFLPWSIFLAPAVAEHIDEWKQRFSTPQAKNRLYLWLWTATVTAFFSLSRGKCDYYVLPVYPAVAAIVALYLTEHASAKTANRLMLAIGALFAVAGISSPLLFSVLTAHSAFSNWWITPLALTAFGVLAATNAYRKRIFASACAIFTAICFAGAGFAAQLLPAVNQSQSFDVYANAMKTTPAQTRVGVATSLGHWVDELTFQVERDPVELTDAKSVRDFFTSGPAIGLLPQEEFNAALALYPELRALKLRTLDVRKVSSHPLTPGYVLKRKGALYDKVLCLVSNQ